MNTDYILEILLTSKCDSANGLSIITENQQSINQIYNVACGERTSGMICC